MIGSRGTDSSRVGTAHPTTTTILGSQIVVRAPRPPRFSKPRRSKLLAGSTPVSDVSSDRGEEKPGCSQALQPRPSISPEPRFLNLWVGRITLQLAPTKLSDPFYFWRSLPSSLGKVWTLLSTPGQFPLPSSDDRRVLEKPNTPPENQHCCCGCQESCCCGWQRDSSPDCCSKNRHVYRSQSQTQVSTSEKTECTEYTA